MLIPSENEISRAGPLLASCRSESIHSGSPDNPQRNIQHEEERIRPAKYTVDLGLCSRIG
jgi:hypothetical protein